MKISQSISIQETSIREQIIAELINRLSIGFTDITPMRGYTDKGIPNCPAIVLLEGKETAVQQAHRVYINTLQVVIVFYLQYQNVMVAHQEADIVLYDILRIVETDKDFNKLVNKYAMTLNERELFLNIIGIAITYNFEYVNKFK